MSVKLWTVADGVGPLETIGISTLKLCRYGY